MPEKATGGRIDKKEIPEGIKFWAICWGCKRGIVGRPYVAGEIVFHEGCAPKAVREAQ